MPQSVYTSSVVAEKLNEDCKPQSPSVRVVLEISPWWQCGAGGWKQEARGGVRGLQKPSCKMTSAWTATAAAGDSQCCGWADTDGLPGTKSPGLGTAR